MGRGFALRDGRPAVDFLLEQVLAPLPVPGGTALGFPVATEVHPNSFLKTLLEAGVPLEHGFAHGGGRRTLADVLEGARALFRPAAAQSDPNALPWSLIAFTRTTSPLKPRWTNAWGESVDLDQVVEAALAMLERASAPLAQAMGDGRLPDAPAPVNAFTCGGTHMLYAALTAVQHGYAGRDRAERVRRQVDVLVWRLEAEPALIDRFYRARSAVPGAAWYALGAKLKFAGHAEECLALAAGRKTVALSAQQAERRRAAVAALRALLGELDRRDLAEAERVNRELFRQIVGDVGHARHGLTLAANGGGRRPA
jgi:hypothetical protein